MMATSTDETATCPAVIVRTGKQCGRPVVEGGYCGHHRPSTRATRSRNGYMRGLGGKAKPQPIVANEPRPEREETYEAIITEGWASYDSGQGMNAHRHRALDLALKAMAARDQDARDRIRLKVSEQVRDLISFDAAPETPCPAPTPWQNDGATVVPLHAERG